MTKDQLKQLEADLWSAADNLRANSDLKSSEYSTPVLGLIFLKFADNNYRRHEAEIITEYQQLKGTRREKPISAKIRRGRPSTRGIGLPSQTERF
jgi:type I restriction enzyme M protein